MKAKKQFLRQKEEFLSYLGNEGSEFPSAGCISGSDPSRADFSLSDSGVLKLESYHLVTPKGKKRTQVFSEPSKENCVESIGVSKTHTAYSGNFTVWQACFGTLICTSEGSLSPILTLQCRYKPTSRPGELRVK